MSNTEQQLSEALTAEAVAHRGTTEALMNRVASLMSHEQVERLKLTDEMREEMRVIRADIAEIRIAMTQFEVHMRTLAALLKERTV